MKKVFVLLALGTIFFSCKPETDVDETAKNYESISAQTDQFSTDKDDVPSGGNKGSNGDGE